MKLASLKHGRDGQLVVVSRDLKRAADASHVVPTLQAALDDWGAAAPRLQEVADALEAGRIALNLKGLSYEILPIHLTKQGGEQRRPEYRSINPQMRVPALALSGGEVLTQSLAIIDYIEETHPQPRLLPDDPVRRANIRAIAQTIACDIHPLNNLVVLQYLKRTLDHDQATIDAWYVHWIVSGFEAIEAMIAPGPYAFGAEVTLADLCLVPQVANARRYKVPLEKFPRIVAVDAVCQKLAAFEQARPENQPDAE